MPVVPGRAVADAGDAAAAAEELGYPVAVKRSSAALRHKSEAGALRLDLADPAAVRDAYRGLADANGSHVLVERMAAPGTELLVAARADAVVPVLVLGLGGRLDRALRRRRDRPAAGRRRPRGGGAAPRCAARPLLTGGRGGAPLDLRAAAELAAGAGDVLLAERLALLELNPVIVGLQGAVAVDATARRGTA